MIKAVKKITLDDVAAHAGVSKVAVSAALNPGRSRTTKVSPEKVELIRKAAKELGYRVNFTAQSLKTGRSGYIGFMLSTTVTNGWQNPYFNSYLQGAEAECRRLGYGLSISCAPFSDVGKFIHSGILGRQRIDGLILSGELDPGVYAELKDSGIPYIVINARPKEGIPSLGKALPHELAYICSCGHRKIMMTTDYEQGRKEYVFELARQISPDIELEVVQPEQGMHPNWEAGFGMGRYLFEKWLAMPEEKRSTIVFSNGVLAEFYRELIKSGRKCPDDVSLIGENTLDSAFCINPIFDRVCGNHEKVGMDAVSILVKAIESGSFPDPEYCRSIVYTHVIHKGETMKCI